MSAFLSNVAINAYPLPARINGELYKLARESDVLMFGEVHGTREVPRIMVGLLAPLQEYGYRVLALEIPRNQTEWLTRWAIGHERSLPPFFATPSKDGRGSLEMLALAREAIRSGWLVCGIDSDPLPTSTTRDFAMASALTEAIIAAPLGSSVLAVTGNLHSRLSPDTSASESAWPSCAHHLKELNPMLRLNSVAIVFHGGEFFNNGTQMFPARKLAQPVLERKATAGHTVALHLPAATRASFQRSI